jgi:hypothetical protein
MVSRAAAAGVGLSLPLHLHGLACILTEGIVFAF